MIPPNPCPNGFFNDWAWVAMEHNSHGGHAPNGHTRVKIVETKSSGKGRFVYYQNTWSNITTKVTDNEFVNAYRCIPLVDPLDEWVKKQ